MRSAEQPPDDEAAPLPALGHGARRNRRHGVHEGDHVEEDGQHAGIDAAARERPAALPQEHPVAVAEQGAADRRAETVEVRRHVERAQRQGEPDEEEPDEAEAEDGEVRAHDVRRVLGPAEAGLDEGEPRLHEDDQDRPDHHPQHVEAPGDGRDRVFILGVGDAAGEDGDERGAGEAAEEVLEPSFSPHGFSLFRGP